MAASTPEFSAARVIAKAIDVIQFDSGHFAYILIANHSSLIPRIMEMVQALICILALRSEDLSPNATPEYVHAVTTAKRIQDILNQYNNSTPL